MEANNTFFTDSEREALERMVKMASCDVKQCVCPHPLGVTYYISAHGQLFSVRRIHGKYLTCERAQASKQSHSKRRDGGITYRLSNGHHGPGGECFIKAELLVFCTFCTGRWIADLQIDFKNGRADDIRPDNLIEHVEEIPRDWPERLNAYADLYRQNFERVVKTVKWFGGICSEDAKDIAQDVFIWLCTSGFKGKVNVALWCWYSKLRCIDFFHAHQSKINTNDIDAVLEVRGRWDKPVEVDLYHLQRGEKRARYLTLYAQGCTPSEIAEMCGTTLASTGSMISRSVQFLRKYLRYEEKYLR